MTKPHRPHDGSEFFIATAGDKTASALSHRPPHRPPHCAGQRPAAPCRHPERARGGTASAAATAAAVPQHRSSSWEGPWRGEPQGGSREEVTAPKGHAVRDTNTSPVTALGAGTETALAGVRFCLCCREEATTPPGSVPWLCPRHKATRRGQCPSPGITPRSRPRSGAAQGSVAWCDRTAGQEPNMTNSRRGCNERELRSGVTGFGPYCFTIFLIHFLVLNTCFILPELSR